MEEQMSAVFRPLDVEKHLDAVVELVGKNGRTREFRNQVVDGYGREPEGLMVILDGRSHGVVGFLWLEVQKKKQTGRVKYWYLAVEWRNKGLEKQMEEVALAYFKRKGVKARVLFPGA